MYIYMHIYMYAYMYIYDRITCESGLLSCTNDGVIAERAPSSPAATTTTTTTTTIAITTTTTTTPITIARLCVWLSGVAEGDRYRLLCPQVGRCVDKQGLCIGIDVHR
jgi:predicted S18 family serine protease